MRDDLLANDSARTVWFVEISEDCSGASNWRIIQLRSSTATSEAKNPLNILRAEPFTSRPYGEVMV